MRQTLQSARRLNGAAAERSGNSLVGLAVRDKTSGLGGRMIVALGKRDLSRSLPWTRLGVGSPVLLSEENAIYASGRTTSSERSAPNWRVPKRTVWETPNFAGKPVGRLKTGVAVSIWFLCGTRDFRGMGEQPLHDLVGLLTRPARIPKLVNGFVRLPPVCIASVVFIAPNAKLIDRELAGGSRGSSGSACPCSRRFGADPPPASGRFDHAGYSGQARARRASRRALSAPAPCARWSPSATRSPRPGVS